MIVAIDDATTPKWSQHRPPLMHVTSIRIHFQSRNSGPPPAGESRNRVHVHGAVLSERCMQLHASACEACLCTRGGSRERNKGIAVSQKELKRGAIYATRINHSGLDLMHLIGRNTHYRCWPLRFARSALAASRFAMRSRNSRSVRCMAVSMSCRPAMESICP